MEKLAAELKNRTFRRVYLFYGEEKYLIRQYQSRLIETVLGDNAGMNLSVFEGKNADPKEIMSQAQTMPFFAEYRVILVQESGFYKKTPEGMAEYLAGQCDFSTAVDNIKKGTRHFAKRQITWYKKMPYIHWFPVNRNLNYEKIVTDMADILEKNDKRM